MVDDSGALEDTLQRIRQQTEGLFLDRAFARVRIRGLIVVGLLILLGNGGAAPSAYDDQGYKPRPHPATAKQSISNF